MNDTTSDTTKHAPRGQALLELPQHNKGTAFSWEERLKHGLLGLLPPHEETLEQQVARAYRAYEAKSTDLERHIYLRQLQDFNEVPVLPPDHGSSGRDDTDHLHADRGRCLQEILRNLPQAARTIRVPIPNATMSTWCWTTPRRIMSGRSSSRTARRSWASETRGAGGMGIPIGKLALYNRARRRRSECLCADPSPMSAPTIRACSTIRSISAGPSRGSAGTSMTGSSTRCFRRFTRNGRKPLYSLRISEPAMPIGC